ncbi:hypothetical protein QOZ88_02920 [Blastococcus sp. BMG 814]|uniref:LXG domain of WXG superfamily protein n=1 Tax=Blastococcus carthaginiensis TaxID=3050034 RepID=A0ABT9I7P3_9ACTN|nr:hypothetical protein [Blastococcus carthaginiensis]MDP5181577.1 hypothetical protein [Blastococcus carthaginiensis]
MDGIEAGIADVDHMLKDLEQVGVHYQCAYDNFARVLAAGHEHNALVDAATDALVGAVLGITLGATVALSLSRVFTLAPNAGFALQAAAEVRNGLVATVMQTSLEAAGEAAVKASQAPGQDQPPEVGRARHERQHPTMQRVATYQQAADLYRRLATLAARAQRTMDVAALVSNLRADSRELAVTGTVARTGVEELEREVRDLDALIGRHEEVARSVQELTRSVASARADAAVALAEIDERRLERDIWIVWMGSLTPEQAEVLDSTPVEDRLHDMGIMARRGYGGAQSSWQSTIGWSVGVYHSDAESREGVRLAREAATSLQMTGRAGTYRRRGRGGVFVDSDGREWPARHRRSDTGLDDTPVVVVKASPGGFLEVDAPDAAADDRLTNFRGRQLLNEVVDLTRVVERVNANGLITYLAIGSTPRFPGDTWMVRLVSMEGRAGRPVRQGRVIAIERAGTFMPAGSVPVLRCVPL